MTVIAIRYDKEKSFCGFDVSGHAGYGEAGSDIVCAAVSALSQTALLGLLKYAPDKTTYTIDEEKGMLSVRVSDHDTAVQVIMDTLTMGLKEVAQQYPEYVVLHL